MRRYKEESGKRDEATVDDTLYFGCVQFSIEKFESDI